MDSEICSYKATETCEVVHAFHRTPKFKWIIEIHSAACCVPQGHSVCKDTTLCIDLCQSKYGLLISVIDGIEAATSKTGPPLLDRKVHLPLNNRSVNKSLHSQLVGKLGSCPYSI